MSEKKNRKGVCGGGGCADGEAAATKRGVAPRVQGTDIETPATPLAPGQLFTLRSGDDVR